MRVNLEYRTMVEAAKTASVKLSVFHLCLTVGYPAPRMKTLVEEGINETLSHFCNLVMDSHVVKVTSHLAHKHNEHGRAS